MAGIAARIRIEKSAAVPPQARRQDGQRGGRTKQTDDSRVSD